MFQRGKRSKTSHLDVFTSVSPVAHPRIGVVVPRDADDVPILATLAAASADVLVTGDGDLLALRGKYPIETPAEFVRRLT